MKYMTSVLGAAVVCALGACADAPTALRVPAHEVPAAALGGDPPPPPADGDADQPFVLACVRTNTPFTFECDLVFIVPIGVRGLVNPTATAGFVTLTSLDPRIVVSDPARIVGGGSGFHGVGTMLIPFDLVPNSPVSSGSALVDLSTATLQFQRSPEFGNSVQVTAKISRPNGDPIVVVNASGETTWFSTGAFAFSF